MSVPRPTPEQLADFVLGLLEPEQAAAVEAALAGSAELRAEAARLRAVLYSLPEELEPDPLPPQAWGALRARLAEAALPEAQRTEARLPEARLAEAALPEAQRTEARLPEARLPEARSTQARPTMAPPTEASGPVRPSPEAPASEPRPVEAPPTSPPPKRGARPWGAAFVRPAFATLLALLVVTATWGVFRARDASALEREQRIIANWMRNPEARIVPLEPTGTLRAGILCLMPDGRAMVLQPDRAPAGSTYVVYASAAGGRVELAAGRGRMLLFRAEGLTEVSLDLRGARAQPVATVSWQ